jgi:outer membrane protein TolC
MSNETTTAQLRSLRALFAAALLLCGVARADDVPDVERVARSLVDEALGANLGLDQAESNVDQRLAILDQARAEYLPQIDLQLRYSEANGGRTIEVPALGLDFRFLREREQDSYVRLVQPIYDPRLAAQKRGAGYAWEASRHGLDAYRLRLARDVRQAYYRWLTARESIGVLEATAGLAKENERVNDSLYRNGKVTRDLRLSAEAEHLEITQQILRARAAEDLARRYLNLLCNAPLAASSTLSVALRRLTTQTFPSGAMASARGSSPTGVSHSAASVAALTAVTVSLSGFTLNLRWPSWTIALDETARGVVIGVCTICTPEQLDDPYALATVRITP